MGKEKVVIIGSGPAGLTAAIYTARAALKPVVIEGKTPGGQLMKTTTVENWPGEIAINGPKLMIKMQEQAKKVGARFISDKAIEVNLKQKQFLVKTERSGDISCDTLIIATGANSRMLGIPGEKKYFSKGVSTCAVCDGALFRDKKVAIVGGGDSAMENASFMTNLTKKITIIHVLDKLTASKPMADKILKNPKIKIIYNSTVTEIIGDKNVVKKIKIKDQKSGKIKKLELDAVFISIGLIPNTKIFEGQLELERSGHIIQKNNTETSIKGVFVAGDAADFRYRQAITAAGQGCMAAFDAENYLKKTV